MAMQKTVKKAWIEALRSGEYMQAFGSLHPKNNKGYCCLGVLCKVTGTRFNRTTDFIGNPFGEVRGKYGELTKKFGLTERCINILVKKNDSHKRSFGHIATWINRYC